MPENCISHAAGKKHSGDLFFFSFCFSPAYQPTLSTVIANCETLKDSISDDTDSVPSHSMGSLKTEDNEKITEKTSTPRREFEINERKDKNESGTGNDITNNDDNETKDDDTECVVS